MQNKPARIENIFFFGWLSLILVFFCWSRFDSNDRIYYFGDGNAIVKMTGLLVQGYSWDEGTAQLIENISYQKELQIIADAPQAGQRHYNFSGFVVVAAFVCKTVYAAGLTAFTIPQIIHALNVFFQALTLGLLYLMGARLRDKQTGLLAMTFFTAFPLAVMEAHYERQESWLCLLATMLFYVSLQFRESPRWVSCVAGLLIGLSIAAKFSHFFLLLVPGVLVLHLFFEHYRKNGSVTLLPAINAALLVLGGMTVALLVNVPFIFAALPDYFAEIASMKGFYELGMYPFGMEHYSYAGQLAVILRYFSATLGPLALFFVAVGSMHLLYRPWRPATIDTAGSLALILPLLFTLLYFASQHSFIERSFSCIEGQVSLLFALGFMRLLELCTAPTWRALTACTMISIILAIPLRLDYIFVAHYIQKADKPLRLSFESILKKEFSGFWIKNVYYTFNYSGELPEKSPKAPRLYKVEDLNEHWSRNYVEKLKANGFIEAGIYCSEFSNLPPNNLTIYHSAAKYHYFVRAEDWPAAVARDYFQTNCQ